MTRNLETASSNLATSKRNIYLPYAIIRVSMVERLLDHRSPQTHASMRPAIDGVLQKMPRELMRPYHWGTVPLTRYKDSFGTPQSAIYPFSYMHATPALVLGKERVTCIDVDAEAVRMLRKEGIKAVRADVRRMRPRGERHDLIVLLQPELGARHVLPHLKEGGYVLTNAGDYIAEELLFEHGGFVLLGAIDFKRGELCEPNIRMMETLQKSWQYYKQMEEHFTWLGKDFEEWKSFYPSEEVLSRWKRPDLFVLKRE